MKGIETMVSNKRGASNGQAAPVPIQLKDLHWREMDLLVWCMDSDGDQCIAVTPGKPPYRIRREYVYCRPLEKAKKFIDAGLIAYYRTEIYPNGVCCDIYKITAVGKELVNAYYGRNHEKNAERDAAFNAKKETEQRENWRTACHAALKQQFGVNLYLPAIYSEISGSETPFIDSPLPKIAPCKDGQPITIKEYLLMLWASLLTDKGRALIDKFLTWGIAIGFDEAAAMLMENDDYSASDLFGLSDSDE